MRSNALLASVCFAVVACNCLHSTMAGRDNDASTLRVNPIRKVVTLLQTMAKKVDEEGEKEKVIYDKFKCHCKTAKADLEKSIGESSGKLPSVKSDTEEAQNTVAKLKEELKGHRAALDAAKKAMAEAKEVREKEQEKFDAESGEKKGFIASLDKALPALQKGMTGTQLLQTESALAAAVRGAAAADSMLTDDDRESVMSFLGEGSGDTYVPVGGEIVGIITNMKADYEKDVASLTEQEGEAVKLYEDLMDAKKREEKTLMTSIQKKTERVGDLSVKVIELKHDLTELESMLAADQEMLANLVKDESQQTASHQERQKTQAEELDAIHSTIRILNDDDALDVFKATLPSGGSLLQLERNGRILQTRLENARAAASMLKREPQTARPEVRFLEMALMGKKVDFGKVTKLIDDMVGQLAKEQTDDDNKKKYCKAELHAANIKSKDIGKSITEQEANRDDRLESLQAITDDIKTMKSDVADLDKLVADATAERKEQNQEYTELMSSKTAAKEILEFAKKRLAKFYNPDEQKKAAGLVAMRSTVKDPFPDAVSPLSQIPSQEGLDTKRALFKVLDARRPASALIATSHRSWSRDSNKVVGMLNQLIHDLSTEMSLAGKDEEHAQKAYEGLMGDSARKRSTYMKSINVKQSALAENEELKTREAGTLAGTHEKLAAAENYKLQLHNDCDWMLQNFELRASARADEKDNLKKAKAVLHGADYSLVQSHTFLSRQW